PGGRTGKDRPERAGLAARPGGGPARRQLVPGRPINAATVLVQRCEARSGPVTWFSAPTPCAHLASSQECPIGSSETAFLERRSSRTKTTSRTPTAAATTSPFLPTLLTTPGSAALRIKNSELPSAIQIDETAHHEVARRLGAGVQVYDCHADTATDAGTF